MKKSTVLKWLVPSVACLLISNAAFASKISDKAITDFLKKHPEAVYNALVDYQKQTEEKQMKASLQHLKSNFQSSFLNSNDGSMGPDKAKVNIVVFSDRQCGYCKKAWKVMSDLTKKEKDLRVSFKETPILGPGSTIAAKVAIWSQIHGKFEAVDQALSSIPAPLDKAKIQAALKAVGISEAEVEQAIADKTIESILQENRLLASKVGLRGTPMLFIANHDGSRVSLISNFMDDALLQGAISEYKS